MGTALRRVDGGRGTGRYYETPEGDRLPSVTSILQAIGKPALIKWAADTERELVVEAAADLYEDLPMTGKKMSRMGYLNSITDRLGKVRAHERQKDAAADIGSQAHAMIEWFLRDQLGQKAALPKVRPEAMWSAQAFEAWWKDAGLVPVHIEQMVFSRTYGYAGTMDLLARGKAGELVVVDFKTSKAIYSEYHLQVAAYREAVNEMGHGPVARGLIVRLPKHEKDAAFEVEETEDLDRLFRVFQNVHALWRWQQENDAKWRARKQGGVAA